jgi:GT2 family glycosyltransferase
MPEIAAVIVSHNRRKQLVNMIWQLENQIVPFKDIKLYVSGYEDGELIELEKKYEIVYCRDMKDWGHDKRAQAINECRSPYLLCASDDDVYTYHFTEAIAKMMLERPGAQIYATDFRTQREADSSTYGHHIAEPVNGHVTNGCMVIDAAFARDHKCYKYRHYEADGKFCEEVVEAGGKFVRVPYLAMFHY